MWITFIVAILFSFSVEAAENFDRFPKWKRVLENETLIPREKSNLAIREFLQARHIYYLRRQEYVADDGDYWQTREEFIRRKGGDCEDFSIALLYDLLDAGYPAGEIYLAVVYRKADGQVHAILIADKWVADLRSDQIYPLQELGRYYEIIYLINRDGVYDKRI